MVGPVPTGTPRRSRLAHRSSPTWRQRALQLVCASGLWWACPAAAQAVETGGVEAAAHVGYALRGLADDDQRHGAAVAITLDAPPAVAGWSGRLGLDLLAFAPTAQVPPRLMPLLSPALTWRLVEGPQTVTAAFGPVVGAVIHDGTVDAAFGAKAALQTRFAIVDGVAVVAAVGGMVVVGDGVVGTACVGLSVDPQAMWARAQRGEDTTDIAVEVAPELAPVLHGTNEAATP